MKNVYKNMCMKYILNMNNIVNSVHEQLPQSYDVTSDSESLFSYKENNASQREPT